jgi:hypothetical protein
MYPRPLSGLLLITCGLAALVYHGMRWTTTGTTLELELAALNSDNHLSIPLPLLVGFVGFASGTPLLLSGRPKPL